jgi:hypothetical protein
MLKKLATLLIAIFAVFIVHMIDGQHKTGDQLRFANNGVLIYIVNPDKASPETTIFKAYVPNIMIRSIERL